MQFGGRELTVEVLAKGGMNHFQDVIGAKISVFAFEFLSEPQAFLEHATCKEHAVFSTE